MQAIGQDVQIAFAIVGIGALSIRYKHTCAHIHIEAGHCQFGLSAQLLLASWQTVQAYASLVDVQLKAAMLITSSFSCSFPIRASEQLFQVSLGVQHLAHSCLSFELILAPLKFMSLLLLINGQRNWFVPANRSRQMPTGHRAKQSILLCAKIDQILQRQSTGMFASSWQYDCKYY